MPYLIKDTLFHDVDLAHYTQTLTQQLLSWLKKQEDESNPDPNHMLAELLVIQREIKQRLSKLDQLDKQKAQQCNFLCQRLEKMQELMDMLVIEEAELINNFYPIQIDDDLLKEFHEVVKDLAIIKEDQTLKTLKQIALLEEHEQVVLNELQQRLGKNLSGYPVGLFLNRFQLVVHELQTIQHEILNLLGKEIPVKLMSHECFTLTAPLHSRPLQAQKEMQLLLEGNVITTDFQKIAPFSQPLSYFWLEFDTLARKQIDLGDELKRKVAEVRLNAESIRDCFDQFDLQFTKLVDDAYRNLKLEHAFYTKLSQGHSVLAKMSGAVPMKISESNVVVMRLIVLSDQLRAMESYKIQAIIYNQTNKMNMLQPLAEADEKEFYQLFNATSKFKLLLEERDIIKMNRDKLFKKINKPGIINHVKWLFDRTEALQMQAQIEQYDEDLEALDNHGVFQQNLWLDCYIHQLNHILVEHGDLSLLEHAIHELDFQEGELPHARKVQLLDFIEFYKKQQDVSDLEELAEMYRVEHYRAEEHYHSDNFQVHCLQLTLIALQRIPYGEHQPKSFAPFVELFYERLLPTQKLFVLETLLQELKQVHDPSNKQWELIFRLAERDISVTELPLLKRNTLRIIDLELHKLYKKHLEKTGQKQVM